MTELFDEIDLRYEGRFRLMDLSEELLDAVVIAYGDHAIVIFPTPLDGGQVHVEIAFYVDGCRACIPIAENEMLDNFEVTFDPS